MLSKQATSIPKGEGSLTYIDSEGIDRWNIDSEGIDRWKVEDLCTQRLFEKKQNLTLRVPGGWKFIWSKLFKCRLLHAAQSFLLG